MGPALWCPLFGGVSPAGFCGVATASRLPFLPEGPWSSVPVGCFGEGPQGRRVRLPCGEGETWATQGLSCR